MEGRSSGLDMDKLFASINQSTQDAMQRLTGDPLANYAQLYNVLLKDYQNNQRMWMDLQNSYLQGQMQLWMNLMGATMGNGQNKTEVAQSEKGDKRFAAAEWQEYPLFDYIKQSYLLTSKMLMQAVENANLDEETRKKMKFFTKQFVDAMSPANYAATNPEVLKMAMDTKGESVAAGFKNLLADLEKGRISMTDESAFEVGKNLAVTPGAVIYENQLIQLIQYAPATDTVYARPLLMVPPCINKFYIMDLQPDNSLVRYAVEQGHTVFLISWRNIDATTQHLTWDDYLDSGVIKALEVVREVSSRETVNTLGFCVGGTLLASALAVLEAQGKHWAESLTMMTALLEFSYVGDIGVYVDRAFVEAREHLYKTDGVVPGRELALAFSSLRANDLIWSYVVNNYLKGKAPDAFDLLYWNSDATNLPGPMFAYYLRHTYLENNLIKPNRLVMCGTAVDLGKVDVPAYVFAAIEDHIVPWRAAYESARYLGSEPRFVLGASGHIAGSMNSVVKNRRNYWVDGEFVDDPDDWYKAGKSVPGSWWSDWSAWLKDFAGERIKARAKVGSRKYQAIEPAPGRYVQVRAAKA
jgi:polyhydroxyalkanoate synthase subunit PhaC